MGDVTVQLAGGSYRLSSPLTFGAADGGNGGTTVSWVAAPGSTPVITGAQAITGWTLFDSTTGVYSADSPVGLDSRDLYVGGALAPRASIPLAASDISITATGFTLKNSALNYLSTLPEQNRIEFESTASFTDRYAPVSSISGTTVTMAQPAWNNNLWGWDTVESPFGTPVRHLENSLRFLTTSGQWFVDPVAGKLYYKPAAGVDPNSLDIELPKLQSLVDVGGSYAAPASNLTFQGIQFSGTSWLGPSNSSGYANQQTGTFIEGSRSYFPADAITSCKQGCPAFERARSTWNQIPAAVQVAASSGITFSGDTFTDLGEVGLGIGNDNNATDTGVGLGVNNINVVGNTFTNLGGSGIIVGGVQADAHHPSATNMTVQNVLISNNTVSGVALDYKDNAGILSTYVTAATITHNEVENLTYTGIAVGFGWGVNDAGGSQDYTNRGYYTYNTLYSTPTTLANNIVANNRVHHVTQLMYDGGGIYTLSASPGSVIKDNYVSDLNKMNTSTGLYLDEGSSYLSLDRNVVQDAGRWARGNYFPLANSHDLTLDNNYHNAGILDGTFDGTSNDTITNDHPVQGTAWPLDALNVLCNSGVQSQYRTSLNTGGCGSPVSGSFSTTASTPATFDQFGSQFAISAAGGDIWSGGSEHFDAFGAIYRAGSVTSGTSVTARVDQQNDANAWAKTGVVIRNNLAQPGSASGYAVAVVTPGNGVSFQWDSNGDGYLDSYATVPVTTTQPIWVRLARSGTQVSAFYSTDGTTFTQIGTAKTITGATTSQDGGIIATSHDATTSAVNFVSNLQIVNGITSGTSFFATGNAVGGQSGTSYSLAGAGADIWAVPSQHADGYATIYKAASVGATASVSAEVVQQNDLNGWAKSGVVMRSNLAQPGTAAGYAVVVVTPSNGINFQWDSNGDGYLDSYTTANVSTRRPVWVKLTRNGSQVSGFYSLDGTTYTQIGVPETLTGATTLEDGGLISTSHDTASLNANSYNNLLIG